MSKNAPKVKVSTKKKFSVVWVIPIVALFIALGIFIRTRLEQGPVVNVLFRNGAGLVSGHTPVKYHGIEVGEVKSLRITKDQGYVVAQIQLLKTASAAAKEGTQFWIVRSEIGLRSIKHLGALVSGPYIEVRPGNGKKTSTFLGSDRPDAIDLQVEAPGKDIVIRTAKLGSLKKGDKILYRGVPVGYVKDFDLAKDSRYVLVSAHIDFEYAPLVRTNSKFWTTSGIDIDFGLRGLKIKTGSIDSLISGGIAFATPDYPGAMAADNAIFDLYWKPREEWLDWAPRIWLVSSIKKLANLEFSE